MPLDCLPPNPLFSALVADFSETRLAGTKEYGIVKAVKERTELQLREACIEDTKILEGRVRMVKELEAGIFEFLLRFGTLEENDIAWFVYLDVLTLSGEMTMRSRMYQMLKDLYLFRYGGQEQEKLEQVFSNPDNHGKYQLFMEYGRRDKSGEWFIRKLWLDERQETKPQNEGSGTSWTEPAA